LLAFKKDICALRTGRWGDYVTGQLCFPWWLAVLVCAVPNIDTGT